MSDQQHWGPTISGDIVVICGGTADIGLVASLLKRDPHLALDTQAPRHSAHLLKATLRPWVYGNGMLKGREWLTRLSKVN